MRDATHGYYRESVLAGGKPHARSYRPDLPMPTVAQMRDRHPTASLTAWADRVMKEDDKRNPRPSLYPAETKTFRAGPHPQSYRPDLPLRGFSDAALTRITKEDRAYYAAHPMTMHETSCETPTARQSDRARAKAEASFHALNITRA